MSTSIRSATPVCLVICWPRSVASAAGPAQLLRRLVEDHLPATWGIETADQAEALAAPRRFVEAALLARKTKASPPGEVIADGLQRLAAAGLDVATLCLDAELPRGQIERQLAQQGVRGMVTESAASDSPSVRQLPFGIWQLTPQGRLPSRRRWFRQVGGISTDFFSAAAGPTIATINLAAVGLTSSNSWRELEKAIDQAATASDRGQIRIATVADLTAELTRQSAAKPQRSILRAA